MTTSFSPVAEPAVRALRRGRARPSHIIAAGCVLLLTSCVLAAGIGAADLGVTEIARSAAAHAGIGTSPLSPLAESVVWQLRLPRVVLAAVVGATLSVSGAVLQGLTRNVLADPYLLGVSSGASTGAVGVLLLGLGAGVLDLTAGAFAGGLAAFALVLVLAGTAGAGPSLTRVMLTGVAVGQLFSALTSLVLMASGDAQAVRGITYWLLGSLSGARWTSVAVVGTAALLGTLVCWSRAAALDAMTFGADAASALGIDVARTRVVLLVTTAVMTATAVAASGAIGFVGLILPHLVRRLAGAAHSRLLPVCALGGGVSLVWADTLARTAFAPQEMPVGVVTALVGVPAFLAILRGRGQR